jgi:hypothetical protein
VPWPSGQDFQTAIQHPASAFADGDLRAGQPELTSLGLPKPRAGNFAVVYKIGCKDADQAVRFFQRDLPDREQRYAAISAFLAQAKLAYTVSFVYEQHGVRVNGALYPMIRMEWVRGQSLTTYIGRNLRDSAAMLALAQRWVAMTQALAASGLAHGDLQHGNVLVMPDGGLKLIDYDGMYVPALAGKPSDELGQRNYQHPLRTAADFGPNLDHFSEWVIYVSLVALTLDPGLWDRLHGGDECLLFRKADFENPDASLAFQAMEQSHNDQVQSLAAIFRSLLYLGVAQVPLLDGSDLPAVLPAPTPTPAASADWLTDHVTLAAPGASATADQAALPQTANWLLDHVGPALPARAFSNSAALEWMVLVISVALAIFFGRFPDFLLTSRLVALTTLAVVNLGLWAIRYRQETAVQEAAALNHQIAVAMRQLREVERQISAAQGAEKTAARAANDERMRAINAQKTEIERREEREAAPIKAGVALAIKQITERRSALSADDASAARSIQRDIGAPLLAVQKQLAELDQLQATELAKTLAQQQRDFVTTALRSARLETARLKNIGPQTQGYLRSAGVVCAADVTPASISRVPTVGDIRQQALLAWRRQVESDAQRQIPTTLPPNFANGIKYKYSAQRVGYTTQRDELQAKMASEQTRIAAVHAAERQALAERELAIRQKAQTDTAAIHARFATDFAAFAEQVLRSQQTLQKDLAAVDASLATLRKSAFEIQWQIGKLERERSAYRNVRFAAYVRRAVLPFAA